MVHLEVVGGEAGDAPVERDLDLELAVHPLSGLGMGSGVGVYLIKGSDDDGVLGRLLGRGRCGPGQQQDGRQHDKEQDEDRDRWNAKSMEMLNHGVSGLCRVTDSLQGRRSFSPLP